MESGFTSTVPLANGQLPSSVLEEEGEIYIPPMPTPSQINAEYAKEIAKANAEKAKERFHKSMHESLREQERFRRIADESPEILQLKDEYARKLNCYRETFNGRIRHKFRAHYTREMKLSDLKAELDLVESLVSTQFVPFLIKNSIIDCSSLLEGLSLYLGFPWFNLQKLTDDTVTLVSSGQIDDEVDQLAIQFGHILTRPAHERLAFKLARVCILRAYINSPAGKKQFNNPEHQQSTPEIQPNATPQPVSMDTAPKKSVRKRRTEGL